MGLEIAAVPSRGRPASYQVVPPDEVRELMLVMADARDYAARGRRSLGYALLLRSLVHAERCLQSGYPWAGALLDLTRDLIDQYCEENDVAAEE